MNTLRLIGFDSKRNVLLIGHPLAWKPICEDKAALDKDKRRLIVTSGTPALSADCASSLQRVFESFRSRIPP